MNVTNKKRQQDLLLHYAGEATDEIFDHSQTLSQEKAKIPLTRPYKRSQIISLPDKIVCTKFVFCQAKQENNETISAFHTRLRQLAITCEFDDVDREIKPR